MQATSRAATTEHDRAHRRRWRAGLLTTGLAAAVALAFPAASQGRTLLEETVSTSGALAGSCIDRELGAGDGVAVQSVSMPVDGAVEVRLEGDSADDWDVAVFDADSGRSVAASAFRGSSELAEGFAVGGDGLTVQACRRAGDGAATLTVGATRIRSGAKAEPSQLVRVETPTRGAQRELQALGLDLTEHAGDGFIDVVLHGLDDAVEVRAAGLTYDVLVDDLTALSARQRERDDRFAARVSASDLPSGQDTYRRLADYGQEMKQLAEANPDIVEPITLELETWEGRPVEGLEITTDPELRDGKPVFLQMGLHHAREWPSGEHAIEWAHELIDGYNAGNGRVTELVEGTRTIVIPVVNPDGFNGSREAGEVAGGGDGRGGDALVNIATTAATQEFRRKNCRRADDSEDGECIPPGGLAENGVDLNRNYGGFWGGAGASGDPTNLTYFGPGPFSEPESENIRRLISSRQVTTLITNHTFSNLVLRPPGIASQGDTVDEPLYRRIGRAMADENGYLNQKAFELYDTTGTTEDWSYYSTGGLGYTFEIGCNRNSSGDCIGNFHPPFAQTVAEYEGTSPAAQAVGGEGNREAYFIAQENAGDTDTHSLLRGRAPKNAVLRLRKTFETPTSNEDPATIEDTLDTVLDVPASGQFRWHINPSTRPLVAQERGREADGDPSDEVTFAGDPTTTTPCADFETEDPACWNDHAFEVPGGPGVDNDGATVRIDWQTPASDWDMKVFRDTDGDGSSAGEPDSAEVGQSAQGTTDFEETTFIEPETGDGKLEPGKYVVRVINFAALEPYDGSVTFEGPERFQPAETESWTLTCERPEGAVVTSQELFIDRGERKTIDLSSSCRRADDPPPGGPGDGRGASCKNRDGAIVGTAGDDVLRGTKGRDVIIGRGGDDKINGRGGNDVICAGPGADTVRGGRGRDRINGGKGPDVLRGGRGRDTLAGARGRDRLSGHRGADRLFGAQDRDALRGGKGRDTLRGGKGRDRLFGGKGADVLRGGPGRDRMKGGPGRDDVRQ